MEFALLIPEGKENAIKRSDLVKTCVDLGLVEGNNADRATRRLIHLARKDTVILNLSNGEGYYRPSHDDMLAHAKRFSKAYRNDISKHTSYSFWTTGFEDILTDVINYKDLIGVV